MMKRSVVIKVALLMGMANSLAAQDVTFGAAERFEVPDSTVLEGPEIVDFDGDGVLDLLSGTYSGNLLFRKNTGSNAKPVYAKPEKLKRDGEDIKLKHW